MTIPLFNVFLVGFGIFLTLLTILGTSASNDLGTTIFLAIICVPLVVMWWCFVWILHD